MKRGLVHRLVREVKRKNSRPCRCPGRRISCLLHTVLRTDVVGEIVCVSDGKELSLNTHKK